RIAQGALRKYDLEAALRHLERSLDTWPRNTRALLLAAQTSRRLDNCADAERRLVEYERRRGVTAEGYLEWLLLGVQQGDFDGQIRYLESLVDAEHPAAPLILEALAKGSMSVSRSNAMLSYLSRLLDREPDNAMALLLRGKRWQSLHDPEGALGDYVRVLEFVPTSTVGWLRIE